MTIDFQTGIAANTLLYGSIKRALWSGAHIFMYDGLTTASTGTFTMAKKTTHTTSTTLNLGLGRKLTDEWAVSASLNYEKGGVNYTQLGDKDVSSIGQAAGKPAAGNFTNSSSTTIGLKVGYNF